MVFCSQTVRKFGTTETSCTNKDNNSDIDIAPRNRGLVQNEFTGWPKKFDTIFLCTITLPNINRFSKLFHCQNQEKNVIILYILKIPLHPKCVSTVCKSNPPPEIFWHFSQMVGEFWAKFCVPISRSYLRWTTNFCSITCNFDEVMLY